MIAEARGDIVGKHSAAVEVLQTGVMVAAAAAKQLVPAA